MVLLSARRATIDRSNPARLRSISSTAHHEGTLAAPWLAERMGIDPARIDAMRRAGELIAVREPGSTEWRYPAWQFDGRAPRPGVARVVLAAREAGLDETGLYELLTAPLGLRNGGKRLSDLLVEGRIDEVVSAIRAGR